MSFVLLTSLLLLGRNPGVLFTPAGTDQTVKNIPKPVGAYRVVMEPRVTVAGAREEKKAWPMRRKAIFGVASGVIVLVIAVAIWHSNN